jgi:hypothetical protein
LPSLGRDVSKPGEFDVILRTIRIDYDMLKAKSTQAIAAVAPTAVISIREVEAYPSSGKLVVGLRIAKASDADPNGGRWVYLTRSLQVDADGHARPAFQSRRRNG